MSSSDESSSTSTSTSASSESGTERHDSHCTHQSDPPEEIPTDSDPVTSESVSTPSDAFQVLGNEIRMGILETMLERVDGDGPSRMRFSELFETTDLETTAQFAYHLEQLVGPYLRKVPDSAGESDSRANSNSPSDVDSSTTSTDGRTGAGYELTYAGLKIARAIAVGAYTRRVDHPPIALEDPCPFCGDHELEAHATDNVVEMECTACQRSLLRLQFPPAGLEAHAEALPEAFDRHYRHRLALMRDGVCPECSGSIEATLVPAQVPRGDGETEEPVEETDGKETDETVETGEFDRFQAAFDCVQCGHELRCPVTLSLLEHPAVVSFYHDHDYSVRERPIWNVGHEWAESVLSSEPPCVRVVTELEGDVLALYVDGSLRVVDVQRADGSTATESRSDADAALDTDSHDSSTDLSTNGAGTAESRDEVGFS